MTPQSLKVLIHLQAHGSITNVEANAVHKVRSVSRRITEIRAHGYVVGKEYKTDVTGQRYVKYSYLGKNMPRLLPVPYTPATLTA
jgi:hypothetical protein